VEAKHISWLGRALAGGGKATVAGSLFGICVVSTWVLGCGAHAPRRGPTDTRTSIFPARPGGTLAPSDLAFGGGPWIQSPSEQPYGLSDAELAVYLKPEARAKAARTPVPAPSTPPAPRPAPALPPPPAVATAPEPAPKTEQLHAALVEPKAADRDLERYAQRQQRARELQDYRGGDAVVITTSTLVIILLVVLLIVLLT